MRISVGIGARRLTSGDGGEHWAEATREVPWRAVPRVRGLPDAGVVPTPATWRVEHLAVGPAGVGLAVGSERTESKDAKELARFLRTRDGGRSWEPLQPALSALERIRAASGWPPEKVDSVAARPDGVLAFAWEDPWIFDDPHSHLMVSPDGGDRWRYLRLPDACMWIASGAGPLRVMGVALIAILARPEGAIVRQESRLDWPGLPAGYDGGPSFLHEAHFLSEREGLALSVDWHERGLFPPIVGLARTVDGGRLWRISRTWQGPTFGDPNERHVLTLEVG
jgi:hypothetical protein